MIRKIFKNNKWYISVLSVSILVFSLLCWVDFARDIAQRVLNRFTGNLVSDIVESNDIGENPTEVIEFSENLETDLSFFNKYSGIADSLIDKLDSEWYSHIFMKSSLSRVDSIATYCVIGEIVSNQVLLGDNNWLFYKTLTDGDPIGDYEGTNRYSGSEMESILRKALYVQNKLASRGTKLAILIAPNKENIYSEYMPDIYNHARVSSTDILIDYLAAGGVNIVSPKEELLAEHLSNQLYYVYDTHWNQLGGYIGVRTALASWEIKMPTLSERQVSSYYLREHSHLYRGGDLAQIIGLDSICFKDEMGHEINGTVPTDLERLIREEDEKIMFHFYNEDAQVSETVFLVGDSFKTAMIPSMRQMFRDVYVVHYSHYERKMLDEINPKYLLLEYVERYSHGITNIDSLYLD